ncbi:MAG: precorrin-2 C(20)-methyltransferase [Hyphomicrobiaceae bacterium]|nr:precorrin-2 C(20)-methyltransferase [Hyphomicrobiaceae bacterium]
MATQGTLFGVGVGPGDPKLMTIKAGEVIRTADILAYPVNSAGESQARSIAYPIFEDSSTELPLHIPMNVERDPAREAYDSAANQISTFLMTGKDVAYLCIGDPMFYGSFMYLAARLGVSHKVEVIPGVTSLSACAAQTRMPLAGRTDVLSVIPATLDEPELESALKHTDTAVVIKVGRHMKKVRDTLRKLGLSDSAIVVENGSGAGERITLVEQVTDDTKPYFSTILVSRRDVT